MIFNKKRFNWELEGVVLILGGDIKERLRFRGGCMSVRSMYFYKYYELLEEVFVKLSTDLCEIVLLGYG